MAYLATDDIQDKLLAGIISDEDLKAGDNAIDWLARYLGIKTVDSELLKPIVKRYGLACACYNCCLMQAGTDPTATFNGANGMENSDIYVQKLKLYKAEISALQDIITVEDFGIDGGQGRTSIPVYRA